ncbi:MAG: alcohol dehydrogenase catalytic domain-containing protein [Pseudolysinimonas sp.]
MTVTVSTAHGVDTFEVGAEAVVFLGRGRPLVRIGVPTVVLRPGETLVAVELVTLCDLDRRILSGAEHTRGPVVLGHEQVGRIVALSPLRRPRDATGHRLTVGDRVVWATGVAGHRYGHDRVERGWELSGGCATHVQVLARTPMVRLAEDAPALGVAIASCGAVTAEQLAAAVDHAGAHEGTGEDADEFALADAERAFAALAEGRRVSLRS